MKYLTDIIEDRQSAAFRKADAFFAFSRKQFDEQKKPNIRYINLGMGLIANELKAKALVAELEEIYKQGIQEDIEMHGLNAIIRRELDNHEAYWSYDYSTTWDSLKDYPGITEDCVAKTLNNKNYICPSIKPISTEISPMQPKSSGNSPTTSE